MPRTLFTLSVVLDHDGDSEEIAQMLVDEAQQVTDLEASFHGVEAPTWRVTWEDFAPPEDD